MKSDPAQACGTCGCAEFVGDDNAKFCGDCGHHRNQHAELDPEDATSHRMSPKRAWSSVQWMRACLIGFVTVCVALGVTLIVLQAEASKAVRDFRDARRDVAAIDRKLDTRELQLEPQAKRVDDLRGEASELDEQVGDLEEELVEYNARNALIRNALK